MRLASCLSVGDVDVVLVVQGGARLMPQLQRWQHTASPQPQGQACKFLAVQLVVWLQACSFLHEHAACAIPGDRPGNGQPSPHQGKTKVF